MYLLKAFLAALAFAATSNAQSTSTRCSTTYASTRGAVTTRRTTLTTSCTSTTTTTVRTTVTPLASTITSISTSKFTAISTTSVQTVTSTRISVNTIKRTVVQSASATVRQSLVATSTVPVAAGFSPVRSTLPNSSYSGSKKRRDANGNLVLEKRQNRYPKTVNCVYYKPAAQCVIRRISTTNTLTAARPTSTAYRTITVTSVRGVVRTTTVTSTSTTSTISSTVTTSTSTTTVQVFTSTSTVYAACATPNLASHIGGKAIFDLDFLTYEEDRPPTSYPNGLEIENAATPYDCCVAALSYQNVQMWFSRKDEDGGLYCAAFLGDTCPNGQSSVLFAASTTDDGDGVGYYTVGNGVCGQWNPAPPPDPEESTFRTMSIGGGDENSSMDIGK